MLRWAILAIILTQTLACDAAGSGMRQRLVGDLMKEYMKSVEPDATKLKMGVSYVCGNINKENHELTSKLLEKYNWKDNRLTWTPSDYGGLTQIRIPAAMIWTPDVKVYTAHNEAEKRDEVNAIIEHDGTVLWIPMVVYKTFCDQPAHDSTNVCKISIGSWTYSTKSLDLELDGKGIDTDMYVDNCPYVIKEPKASVTSKEYPCCPGESYSSMHIEFKLTPRN